MSARGVEIPLFGKRKRKCVSSGRKGERPGAGQESAKSSGSPDRPISASKKIHELGWHAVAVMVRVFDCIGQSPIDVIGMRARANDRRAIAVTREKTGVSDAPIPLWPDVIAALDTYLAARPKLHPDAPLFVSEKTGRMWVVSTLAKVHSTIRAATELSKGCSCRTPTGPPKPRLARQGPQRTKSGLARHSTRTAALNYVHPDSRYVTSAQAKRETIRNICTPSVPEKLE
jgi:hypothetical protein